MRSAWPQLRDENVGVSDMHDLPWQLYALVFMVAFGFVATVEESTADQRQVGELTVVISGFDNDDGNVNIALANTPEGYAFESEPMQQVVGEVTKGESRWVFSELSFGEYAIKIYHDENRNDELDTNFLGIPKEGVGFSNNPSARFGEPDFEEAKFVFDSPSMTVDIEIQ